MNEQHRVAELEGRVDSMDRCVSAMRDELTANTEATLRVESNTKELVELLTMAKNGIGFFAGTGRALRKIVIWFGPFVTLIAAVWALMHGKWPGSGS